MRFIVDAQLPPALARMLASKGFSAEHVMDVGLGDSTDSAIWDYALGIGAIILTKDEDFATRISLDGNGPTIIWIRIGNTSKNVLLQWIEPLLPAIVKALKAGEKLVEIV
jgi:predicted nuclease of predicted toxin-antitoxin system